MLITVLEVNKYLEVSDNKPTELLIGKKNQHIYMHRNTQVYKRLLKLGEKKDRRHTGRKLGSPLRLAIKTYLTSQPSKSRTLFEGRK